MKPVRYDALRHPRSFRRPPFSPTGTTVSASSAPTSGTAEAPPSIEIFRAPGGRAGHGGSPHVARDWSGYCSEVRVLLIGAGYPRWSRLHPRL
jgi:hypothetical protein